MYDILLKTMKVVNAAMIGVLVCMTAFGFGARILKQVGVF